MAWLSMRMGLVDHHREWMIRSYVTTFAFVTFRMVVGLTSALEIGTLFERLGVAAWSCWAVPLLLTEAVLQGRRMRTGAGARAPRG